jgi:outer membrane protein assembly factor BamB
MGEGLPASGPDWRAAGAGDHAACHVSALAGDQFLYTDGSRGLMHVSWPEPKVWEKRASTRLSHRIVAPPAIVVGGKELLVAVADAADNVTLLEAGSLRTRKRWSLGGRITAGPFAEGGMLGCVVGKNRLVWLDPARDQAAWEYTFLAEIVGRPLVVEKVLVVADLAGRILALDPQTGSPLGTGYTIRASTAPSTAPLPLADGRLLFPLSDGTLLVVPVARLQEP